MDTEFIIGFASGFTIAVFILYGLASYIAMEEVDYEDTAENTLVNQTSSRWHGMDGKRTSNI